jgi:hypothetical protein
MGIEITPPGLVATLVPSASLQAKGSVTAPTASQSIASIPTPPAGLYQCTFYTELSGTITAAEQDNFRVLYNGGTAFNVLSQATPTTGVVQVPFTINLQLNGLNGINLQALAAGGVAAVYSGMAIVTRIA